MCQNRTRLTFILFNNYPRHCCTTNYKWRNTFLWKKCLKLFRGKRKRPQRLPSRFGSGIHMLHDIRKSVQGEYVSNDNVIPLPLSNFASSWFRNGFKGKKNYHVWEQISYDIRNVERAYVQGEYASNDKCGGQSYLCLLVTSHPPGSVYCFSIHCSLFVLTPLLRKKSWYRGCSTQNLCAESLVLRSYQVLK